MLGAAGVFSEVVGILEGLAADGAALSGSRLVYCGYMASQVARPREGFVAGSASVRVEAAAPSVPAGRVGVYTYADTGRYRGRRVGEAACLGHVGDALGAILDVLLSTSLARPVLAQIAVRAISHDTFVANLHAGVLRELNGEIILIAVGVSAGCTHPILDGLLDVLEHTGVVMVNRLLDIKGMVVAAGCDHAVWKPVLAVEGLCVYEIALFSLTRRHVRVF